MNFRRCVIACSLLFLLIAVSAAAELNPADVRAAATYSANRRGLSLLVIQHGKTLAEEYPGGGSSRSAFKIYSGTKAFWNLAGLAAAEEGLLSLDERVAETIPAWRDDARKSRVTIRELLDFSCGLDPGFFLHADDPGNRDSIAISLPAVAEPGTAFIYGPSALQVFHEILKTKLKGETPTHYLERRVLHRLGLGSQRYLRDRAGNPLLASGWFLTARQWSKMGEIALQKGSPVVSPGSMAQCWRGSSANRAFAFGWWNNRAAPGGREFDIENMLIPKWPQQNWSGTSICNDAPGDLVACIGSLYQRLYVIPSMDLIVVRHGGGGQFSDGRFLRLLLGK
jgi:CubicO group peptidase (beta-lactamase class C family)